MRGFKLGADVSPPVLQSVSDDEAQLSSAELLALPAAAPCLTSRPSLVQQLQPASLCIADAIPLAVPTPLPEGKPAGAASGVHVIAC